MMSEFQNLLARGKKELTAGNTSEAVDILSSATEKGKTEYGEFGAEVYDAYYSYGQALTKWAVEQSTLYAVKEDDDEAEDSESGGEEEAEKKDAEKEDAEQKDAEKKDVEKKDAEKKDDDQAKGSESAGKEDEEKEDAAKKDAANKDDDEAEGIESGGEDDAGDAATAWEVLEIARKICENGLAAASDNEEEARKWKLKHADTSCALGEVLQADEEFDRAKIEFENALEAKKALLEPNDRQLAALYFQIGKTCKCQNNFAGSVAPMERAIEILSANIESLKATSETTTTEEQRQEEVEGLQEMIKDMREQIEDAQQSAAGTIDLKAQLKAAFTQFVNVGNAANNGKINDVTSLLKHKRKQPSEAGDENKAVDSNGDTVAKKSKLN